MYKLKQCQPSGLLPPKIMASMGTPSSLSHWGSMMGHCPAGAQKREFGWAHGVELPLGREETTVYFTLIQFIHIYNWISWLTPCLRSIHGWILICIPLEGTISTMALHFTLNLLVLFIEKAKRSVMKETVTCTKNINAVRYCSLLNQAEHFRPMTLKILSRCYLASSFCHASPWV